VDSAVLLLEPRADAERAIGRAELAQFAELVRAGFKQPRKTLANSLAEGLNAPKEHALQRLVRADIDPSARPQALALDDWVRLFRTA
jgi:16S rRNA (adenine1518-N6/adenine1519-N6)-dimethyltransferase